MKPYLKRESRRGSAVLLVLTFVLIISFALLLYLSRTQSALNQSQSSAAIATDDLMESVAMQATIEDFRNEMLAGSSGTTLPAAGMPMVVGNNNLQNMAMVPGRVLSSNINTIGSPADSNSFFINLVKQSINAQPFYPGSNPAATYTAKTSGATTVVNATGLARASNVNTFTPSANGRYISAERWNKPMLLSYYPVSSTTAPTFQPARATPTNATQLPDWIYVTRAGPVTNAATFAASTNYMKRDPTNSNYVVGRYAYNIYDEGGLLDANVAGFDPANSTANLVVAEGQKGSLGYADLSVIPGMTKVTNFLAWRNPASNTTNASAPNYLSMLTSFGEPNGFSKLFTSGSGATAKSDNRFFTRQDLLNYQASNPSVLTAQALSYLTTFSADLNEPSIARDSARPTVQRNAASGGNDAVDATTNVNYDSLINPDFLSTLNTQLPVMQERFPLDRLAWLTYMGPIADDNGNLNNSPSSTLYVAANATAFTTIINLLENTYGYTATFLSKGGPANIDRYFGLQWNATKPSIGGPAAVTDLGGYWLYDANALSSRGGLKRLAEVQGSEANYTNGREPNFFEILKAAILCGSLGQQYQADNETGGGTAVPLSTTNPRIVKDSSGNLGRDGVIDNHVMQIGANIIDQFDADSYPTRLLLTTGGWLFTGVEDLPYLYGMRAAPYDVAMLTSAEMKPPAVATAGTSPTTAQGGLPMRDFVMLQPLIWDPHASPAIAVATTPTQFRVTASDTGTDVNVTCNDAWWTGGPSVSTYPSTNPLDTTPTGGGTPVSYDPTKDYITFNTATTGGAAFRDPYFLRAPGYPPGSSSVNSGTSHAPTSLVSSGPSIFSDANQTLGASYNEVVTGVSDHPLGFFVGYVWTGGPVLNTSVTPHTDTTPYLTTFTVNANNATFSLQYQDANSNWINYDQIIDMPTYFGGSYTRSHPRARIWLRLDPRNERMGYRDSTQYSPFKTTLADGVNSDAGLVAADQAGGSNTANYWMESWSIRNGTGNSKIATGVPLTPYTALGSFNWTLPALTSNYYFGLMPSNNAAADPIYYKDPDGVNRNGMAINANGLIGLPMATGNSASHPIMLNRPFQSVAELGYAYRGVAWRQLDFFTPQSGDAGLLDAFCLHESTTTTYPTTAGVALNQIQSGKVNLNTRRPEVIQAMLSGVSFLTYDPATPDRLTAADDVTLANDLVNNWTMINPNDSTKGPLRNRSELVGKYSSSTSGNSAASAFTGFSSKLSDYASSNTSNAAISMRRMAAMRGLVDMGTTRTWTFMVDLIVQTGRFPDIQPAPTLDQFVVRGEKHYWIHIAMDRFTGAVISQRTEVVNE